MNQRLAGGALFTLAAAIATVLLTLLSQPALALDLQARQFTLKNGMQVVVIEDHRAPVVTHMVWYRVGSADEPAGKSGLAHFLEHLMFKGTRDIPPGEFSRIIKRHGGQDNAFTTTDYTAYFQRIAREHLPLVMRLEADRMQNLQLKEKDVDTEREVIKEERRMRTDNNPRALFAEQLNAALYLAHPYRRPVVGWMDDVERLTLADAVSFYRRHYTPANAVLVVAGDVTPDEVRKLAEEHYGALKNTARVEKRVRTREPKPLASRRVIMRDERIRAPIIQVEYLAPSYATAKNGRAHALEVLAQALGGGATSLLYRKLVVEEQIATWAGAWYDGGNRDYGTFGIYASPAPGIGMAKLEERIEAIVGEVLAGKGIDEKDIRRAANSLTAEAVYALDSQFYLARMVGEALTTGNTLDDIRQWEKRILAVTTDDALSAARATIRPGTAVTGLLLKKDEKKPAARNNGKQQGADKGAGK